MVSIDSKGISKSILREFIKDINHDDIIVSTKFTPQIASDSNEAMQEMLVGSKKRIHVEGILLEKYALIVTNPKRSLYL